VAVVGGLLFSQIITLYITPVVYTYLDAWQKRLARRKVAEPRQHPEPAAGQPSAAGATG
jgi:HAE1 family hydrophobic/amphiphilic exporter-1